MDDIRRHLAVRDYLRTHADAARAYGALKRRLDAVCRDMAGMGIDRLYLLTDHDGFYERLGWRFEDMVRDDAGEFGRMYIHSAT